MLTFSGDQQAAESKPPAGYPFPGAVIAAAVCSERAPGDHGPDETSRSGPLGTPADAAVGSGLTRAIPPGAVDDYPWKMTSR